MKTRASGSMKAGAAVLLTLLVFPWKPFSDAGTWTIADGGRARPGQGQIETGPGACDGEQAGLFGRTAAENGQAGTLAESAPEGEHAGPLGLAGAGNGQANTPADCGLEGEEGKPPAAGPRVDLPNAPAPPPAEPPPPPAGAPEAPPNTPAPPPPAAPASPPVPHPAAPDGSPAPTPQPAPGDAAVAEGVDLLQQGNLLAAGERFEKALALDPNNETARSRLAYVRLRRADYTGAATNAEAAVRLDPSDSLAYLILGRSKEALADTERARAAYSAAADLVPRATTQERLVASSLALYLRAMLLVQRGEQAGAESDLKEVLRIYEKNGYAQYEYALSLLKGGKNAESLEALKAAEEANETFHPAETWVYPTRRYFFLADNLRFWQGVALRQAGRNDEAIAAFEGLIPKIEDLAGATTGPEPTQAALALEGSIEKSFFGAYYQAALASEAKGDKEKALDLLKRYTKLRLPDSDLLQKVKDLQKKLK